MKKKPEVLALVPARGNSKSIPRKNVLDFAGYPLIAYSIAAARQATSVSRTIVSTDNQEIKIIAEEYGAEVPFIRPAEFAQDDTLDFPVFKHALFWLEENEKYIPDLVVHLRPTSPFRPISLIDEAVNLLLNHPEADSVRGVVPSTQNPYKMWHILEGRLSQLLHFDGIDEPYNTPRQQLPDTYWQTGHIDVIRPKTILKKGSMSGDVIIPVIIPVEYTVDIDTQMDWRKAEQLLAQEKLEIVMPGSRKRKFPEQVKLLVMDFDGVFTDNRVWVDKNGNELVAASRSDGMGIERLKKLTNLQLIVLSKETDGVVTSRCEKLNIPVYQSIENKPEILKKLLEDKGVLPEAVVYIGNDLNDLDCFPIVGFSVAPHDAVKEVRNMADLVLDSRGGFGAVRELAELLIERYHSP